jgi:hypothetical protein
MELTIFPILVAVLLLFFGQKLYWLFVGGIGFIVATELAARWFTGEAQWMILLVAILAGVVGAILAILLQRVAIGIASFLAGGHFTLLVMADVAGSLSSELATIAFIVGGLIAGILAIMFLDWVLIVLSALLGAGMIAQWAVVETGARTLVFLVLFVIGVAAQARMLAGRRKVEAG